MITLEQLQHAVYSDSQVRGFIERPKENCYNCALHIATLLANNSIAYKTLGLLYWGGLSDLLPLNHFVIVCQIETKNIVIDPTIIQFGEFQPFLGEMNDWLDKIKLRLPFKVIKMKEFNSPQTAFIEMGYVVGFSPLDFDWEIIQSTLWYEKIIKNQEQYRIQQQRQLNTKNPRLNNKAPESNIFLRCLGKR